MVLSMAKAASHTRTAGSFGRSKARLVEQPSHTRSPSSLQWCLPESSRPATSANGRPHAAHNSADASAAHPAAAAAEARTASACREPATSRGVDRLLLNRAAPRRTASSAAVCGWRSTKHRPEVSGSSDRAPPAAKASIAAQVADSAAASSVASPPPAVPVPAISETGGTRCSGRLPLASGALGKAPCSSSRRMAAASPRRAARCSSAPLHPAPPAPGTTSFGSAPRRSNALSTPCCPCVSARAAAPVPSAVTRLKSAPRRSSAAAAAGARPPMASSRGLSAPMSSQPPAGLAPADRSRSRIECRLDASVDGSMDASMDGSRDASRDAAGAWPAAAPEVAAAPPAACAPAGGTEARGGCGGVPQTQQSTASRSGVTPSVSGASSRHTRRPSSSCMERRALTAASFAAATAT
mmetsp:Transcript_31094/g.99386  ORF Transcript_31094/g.99386 Transcript_31094/m.99386 type:complete len:411 (+) Transcript_31094:805-2037(+)